MTWANIANAATKAPSYQPARNGGPKQAVYKLTTGEEITARQAVEDPRNVHRLSHNAISKRLGRGTRDPNRIWAPWRKARE